MTGPVPGYFEIVAQTRPDKLDEVVAADRDATWSGRKRARSAKTSSARPQQRVIALHAQENTTIGDQAQQAALDELYGLGYDYRKTFDARIEAVKLKDVVEVARKYFGNHVLVTSSPEKKE